MSHANTSASSLHRRVRCPGSHRAEEGLAEQNSEYAAEGTLLHAALDPTDTAAFDSLEPKQQDVVRSTEHIFAEVIARTVAALAIAPDEPFSEGYERALVLRKGVRPVLTGHCDYWRYYAGPKVLIVTDAKFGFIEVTPAPLNLQLRAYAAMLAQEHDVETAVVAIAQPRAYAIEGAEQLTIARYDRADLALAQAQIYEWKEQWTAADAPRHASEDACRYCKAKLLCDAYRARLDGMRGVTSGIADLSPEDFGALYAAMALAAKEDFVESVKSEARIRITEGRLPGYRLKPNAARRSLNDPVKAAKLLAEKLAFTADEIAAASKVSIGEAETVLRRKKKLKAKDAKTAVSDALATVIELSTPQPSIVPVSAEDEVKSV